MKVPALIFRQSNDSKITREGFFLGQKMKECYGTRFQKCFIPIQLKYCSNPRFPLHRKFICQDNYNKKIAPFSFDKINNVNIPVNINVSMSVIDIIKIAEVGDADADTDADGGGGGGVGHGVGCGGGSHDRSLFGDDTTNVE